MNKLKAKQQIKNKMISQQRCSHIEKDSQPVVITENINVQDRTVVKDHIITSNAYDNIATTARPQRAQQGLGKTYRRQKKKDSSGTENTQREHKSQNRKATMGGKKQQKR